MLQDSHHSCISLPDQMSDNCPLHLMEVLFKLTGHVWHQSYEVAESGPEFISLQLDFFKHLTQSQVHNVLAIQVDNSGVDQEAFLKDVVLEDVRHLLLHSCESAQLFVNGSLYDRAEHLEDWLRELLLHLSDESKLTLCPLHDSFSMQFMEHTLKHLSLDLLLVIYT